MNRIVSGGDHRRHPRLTIFVLAAATTQILILATSEHSRFWNPGALLRSGVVWVLTYQCLSLSRPQLRFTTAPIYIVLIWILQGPIYIGLFLLWIVGGGDGPRDIFQFYSDPRAWLPRIPSTSAEYYDILSNAVLFWISTRLLNADSSPANAVSHATPHFRANGGVHMSPAHSQTTRFLCASAILNGWVRERVLQHLRDPNRATAPELGLDLRLLAQVCAFAEKREGKYAIIFAAVLITSIGGTVFNAPLGILFWVLVSGYLYFHKKSEERYRLSAFFRNDIYDPQEVIQRFPARLEPAVETSLRHLSENMIVYRNFVPFVGCGIDLGGWSFSINTKKPKEDVRSGTIAFSPAELYAFINRSVAQLELQGISSRDALFIRGTDLRENRELLPDVYERPVGSVDLAAVSNYIAGSDSHIRHYQWLRVSDWGQELIISHFMRCILRGPTMFVETNRYILTPVSPAYRSIDSLPTANARRRLAIALSAVLLGPLASIFAPFEVLGRISIAIGTAWGGEKRRRRKEITDDPLFNYGATSSVREIFSGGHFLHYFQKLDADFYNKTLDREILDSICTFLDDHDIDTSELRERQTMILNSGIIVQSGDLKAESLAVGVGARAEKRIEGARRSPMTQEARG